MGEEDQERLMGENDPLAGESDPVADRGTFPEEGMPEKAMEVWERQGREMDAGGTEGGAGGVVREGEGAERPFLVELRRLEERPSGTFRPGARLALTGELRASGLLLALPAEDLKNLLFLLTFLSANGDCLPSVLELSRAMRVSPAKARARMRRLAQFRWQGGPVVTEVRRETGMDAYAPAPHLLGFEEAPARDPREGEADPRTVPAGRERVVAWSRERYTRPRAEVERAMAEQMGWEDLDGPEARLRRGLLLAGVTPEQAERLMAGHDPERIRKQMEWLPYRKAKNPAAFLVAAIEGDYEEPVALRARAREDEGDRTDPAAAGRQTSGTQPKEVRQNGTQPEEARPDRGQSGGGEKADPPQSVGVPEETAGQP